MQNMCSTISVLYCVMPDPSFSSKWVNIMRGQKTHFKIILHKCCNLKILSHFSEFPLSPWGNFKKGFSKKNESKKRPVPKIVSDHVRITIIKTPWKSINTRRVAKYIGWLCRLPTLCCQIGAARCLLGPVVKYPHVGLIQTTVFTFCILRLLFRPCFSLVAPHVVYSDRVFFNMTKNAHEQ